MKIQTHWLTQTIYFGVAVTAFGLLTFTALYAHGDEDHSNAETPVQSMSGRHTASAQSNNFDIVVQYGTIEAGKETNLDIYLSDYETNAPVGGATIEVDISGVENVVALATSEKDPGLYNVNLLFPKNGHFELLFDITTLDKSDIIEVKGIEVGADEVPPQKVGKLSSWLFIAAALVILLIIAVVLMKRNRRASKSTVTTSIILVLLLSLSGHTAHAHGGEDHGDESDSPATSSMPGFMSKSSQFLLGVRTELAKIRMVSKQIIALGRVVLPPTNQAQVFPPQSGLLVVSEDFRYPTQGDWVKKGEPIAVLQVLDQFIIRAPIDGIVSAVHAVPGEQVDQSRELFTIHDYTKVWVEGNLFESDLIHLEPRPTATLSVENYPGETFRARFVNYNNVVDPATRTVKAIYEVQNPKMLLRPGMLVNVNIEAEKRLEALVVPANSIMDWEGTKVVFVHIQPEIFEMRPIKILGYYGELVAIEGGLVEGDRVITAGAYDLLNIPHRLTEGRSQ